MYLQEIQTTLSNKHSESGDQMRVKEVLKFLCKWVGA